MSRFLEIKCVQRINQAIDVRQRFCYGALFGRAEAVLLSSVLQVLSVRYFQKWSIPIDIVANQYAVTLESQKEIRTGRWVRSFAMDLQTDAD